MLLHTETLNLDNLGLEKMLPLSHTWPWSLNFIMKAQKHSLRLLPVHIKLSFKPSSLCHGLQAINLGVLF